LSVFLKKKHSIYVNKYKKLFLTTERQNKSLLSDKNFLEKVRGQI